MAPSFILHPGFWRLEASNDNEDDARGGGGAGGNGSKNCSQYYNE